MSVSQISELRKRSNQFVADIDRWIGEVVDHNEKLIQLNKAQLKASKTSKGSPLVHRRTGSPYYSAPYARKKGYRKPDLFVDGTFYKGIDIVFDEPSEYKLIGMASVTKYLLENYGDEILGIEDKKKAQKITIPELRRKYISQVLS